MTTANATTFLVIATTANCALALTTAFAIVENANVSVNGTFPVTLLVSAELQTKLVSHLMENTLENFARIMENVFVGNVNALRQKRVNTPEDFVKIAR